MVVSISTNVKVLLCGLIFFSGILFSCKSIDGKSANEMFEEIKLQTKTNNKYVYFNIWNTKCVPCVSEMPSIDSLAFLYKNKIDFILLQRKMI